MRRAIRYGDGWIPLTGRGDDDIANHMKAFREACTEAGRNPDEMEVSVFAAPPDKEMVQRYADVGITRIVFGLPPADGEILLPFLDHLRSLG